MVTRPANSPSVERLPRAQVLLRTWRADHSISEASAQHYLLWIDRLRCYCADLGLVEVQELTHEGVVRFRS